MRNYRLAVAAPPSGPGQGATSVIQRRARKGNRSTMEEGMRKVVSGLFISLDGVVESPNQWQFEFDEDMGAALTTTLESSDAVLLGRVTYTEWAGYWPTVTSGDDAGFATWINTSPK